MEYEIENPIQGRDVPMKLCDSSNNLHDHPPQQQEQQQEEEQQQQPILLPFTSSEEKVQHSSSNELLVLQVIHSMQKLWSICILSLNNFRP